MVDIWRALVVVVLKLGVEEGLVLNQHGTVLTVLSVKVRVQLVLNVVDWEEFHVLIQVGVVIDPVL